MPNCVVSSIVLICFCAVVHLTHSLRYTDLQALGIACPKQDRCAGYRNNLPYTKRSCECDSACSTYDDCCIDARRRRPSAPSRNMICLNYGENVYTGIYAVSKCSRGWTGSNQVKQNCEGTADLRDPISAAPVTSTSQAVTYKNLYCAECNNADMNSLQVFHLKMSCDGLDGLTEQQMMDKLSYNEQRKQWGVNKVNAQGNSDFKECQILFDMPSYLNGSVRFCRANIISKCARDWTRLRVKKACEEYMSVVFDKARAYRNPHCAICNHKEIQGLKCTTNLLDQGKFKPFPLSALIDINGNEPKCPSKHIYDPYLKRCRRLACALPGYVIQNRKCVPGG